MVITGAWVGFSFLYVHDAFHQTNHWLGRAPLVRRWFRAMRRAHDRHHTMLDQHGLVPWNMGISLPLMDLVFRTWVPAKDDAVAREEYIGQVIDTSYQEARYTKFHEVYRVDEPDFDAHVDDDLREHLQDYRPSSDHPIIEIGE